MVFDPSRKRWLRLVKMVDFKVGVVWLASRISSEAMEHRKRPYPMLDFTCCRIGFNYWAVAAIVACRISTIHWRIASAKRNSTSSSSTFSNQWKISISLISNPRCSRVLIASEPLLYFRWTPSLSLSLSRAYSDIKSNKQWCAQNPIGLICAINHFPFLFSSRSCLSFQSQNKCLNFRLSLHWLTYVSISTDDVFQTRSRQWQQIHQW